MTSLEKKRAQNAAYRASHRAELARKANEYYARTKDSERARRNAMASANYHRQIEAKRASRRAWYARQSAEYKQRRGEKENPRKRAAYRVDIEASRAAYRAKYYAHHEERKADARRFREKHKERLRAEHKERQRRDVIELRDWYVAACLELKKRDCPSELIAAKRELLKLRREIRSWKQKAQ